MNTTTSATGTAGPARHGPELPLTANGLGAISLGIMAILPLAAWPFMIAALVCGIIAIRRKGRLWGFGVSAVVIFFIALAVMFALPLALLFLTWAFGGDLSADPGGVWSRFWEMCWEIWLGPLAP